MPSLVTERIESVKAGAVGAASFSLSSLVFSIASSAIVYLTLESTLNPTTIDWAWVVSLGISAVSGFLFGVTYRYVVRDDRNSHLNDGAVLAFGLVRGLALVEGQLNLAKLLSLGGLIVQSIICFAIARLILDLAIARKLIKPFV